MASSIRSDLCKISLLNCLAGPFQILSSPPSIISTNSQTFFLSFCSSYSNKGSTSTTLKDSKSFQNSVSSSSSIRFETLQSPKVSYSKLDELPSWNILHLLVVLLMLEEASLISCFRLLPRYTSSYVYKLLVKEFLFAGDTVVFVSVLLKWQLLIRIFDFLLNW
jgi:hypothetical protein